MQSNILNTLYDAVTSEWRTTLGQLEDLSDTLRNQTSEEVTTVIAELSTILDTISDRTSFISDQAIIQEDSLVQSIRRINALLSTEHEVSLTDTVNFIHIVSEGELRLTLESDLLGYLYTIEVQNDAVVIYDTNGIASASQLCEDMSSDIRRIVLSAAKGKAMNVGLSDVIDSCVAVFEGTKAYDDPRTNGQAFLAVSDKLTALNFSDQEKSVWMNAILAGPRGVLEAVTSFVKRTSDIAAEGSLDLPTTSVVYREYSSGVILGAVGGTLTGIGIAVFGLSRILGLILLAAGAIVNVAGQIVRNVNEALAGTTFSFESDGFHAFDFAVLKGSIAFPYIANLIRLRGYNRVSMLDPRSCLVWFFVLQYPNDDSRDDVLYEAHLSTDFDWTSRLSFHAPNTLNVPGKNLPITEACFTLDDVDGSTGNPIPRLYMASMATINFSQAALPTQFFIPAAAQSINDDLFEVWAGAAYSPCDLGSAVSLRDSLKNKTNDLEMAAAVRFISACIGYGLYMSRRPLTSLFKADWNLGEGYDFVGLMTPAYPTFKNPLTGALFLLQEGFRCLCALWSTSDTIAAGPRDDIYRDDNELYPLLQNLFILCTKCFDGLVFNYDDIKYNVIVGSRYFAWNSDTPAGSYAYTSNDLKQLHTLALHNCSTIIDYGGVRFVTDDWPRKWLIQLPRLTWSAFISGLFIDGLLVLLVTGLIVAGFAVSVKLRNFRSKMEGAVTGARYQYETTAGGVKADGSSYSQLERDKAWKNYKQAMRKYNIVAGITGGTPMRIDSGNTDDKEGIVSKISKLLSGSGKGVSLEDIRILIAGN